MLLEVITHLDKKYSINYKMGLRSISPEEVEIIKNRTASPVVIQTKNQLFFGEEIHETKFEDIVDPPKKTTEKEIQLNSQIIKFKGPSKKKKAKKTKKKKKT